MKPRLSILLSGVALIVLLIVQYYNISVTFQTKKEQFDMRYGGIVKQGLYDYESGATGYLSDSVFFLFDRISEELVFQAGQHPGGLQTDSLLSLQVQILTSGQAITSASCPCWILTASSPSTGIPPANHRRVSGMPCMPIPMHSRVIISGSGMTIT
jgi:hypothetical protein